MSVQPLEPLSVINDRLRDNYGKFEDGRPNWRIVFSDDQYEKREITYRNGIELPRPVVEEVRKYPFTQGRFVLERLIGFSEDTTTDLVTKSSYEPMWTFEDKNGHPLPPIWEAIYMIVERVNYNIANAGHGPKFSIPEDKENTPEGRKIRADRIYAELFGNETKVGDSLALDTAVGYGVRNRHDWTH